MIVLLFNTIAPAAMAADETENGQALLCTTAGLIKVSLADFGDGSDDSAADDISAGSEHCAYCKLAELPNHIQNDLPLYLAPDAIVALNYQSLLSTRAAQTIAEHRKLRAPPSNTLS